MEGQFRTKEVNIFPQKRAVACTAHQHQAFVSGMPCLKVHFFDCFAAYFEYCLPLRPSPDMPLVKLSSQLMFACASRMAIGCPSCSTLCTVIKALKVCTSSARIGCLYIEMNVSAGR